MDAKIKASEIRIVWTFLNSHVIDYANILNEVGFLLNRNNELRTIRSGMRGKRATSDE